MRIEIQETKRRLTKENSALTSQMEKCEQQIDTTTRAIEQSNGLQGEAYDAIRERITMRPLILKTHHIVYEEMRNANEQNIAALEALPRTSDGVLDTDECQRRINRAQERIAQLQTKLDSYIYKLRSNPTPASVINNPVFNYDKEAYIRSLTYNFEGLMEIMRQIIYKEQDNIRQAEQYDQRSAQIYSRMESLIAKYLDPATLSIETCLKTGSYEGTTGWTEGIDAEYNKSRKVRDVETSKLLSDEDLAEYRNAIFASKDGNIDAKSIYDDTGWFNEKLYGILCFLHQNDESLVNGQDIDGISQAYLYMSGGFFNAKGEWVGPNTEAVEQFLNASYFATGEKFTKKVGVSDDADEMVFKKFAPFSLLNKVYEHSVNIFDGMDKPTEGCENYKTLLKQYYGNLAGLKLLQSVSSLDSIDVLYQRGYLYTPSSCSKSVMVYENLFSSELTPNFKIDELNLDLNDDDGTAFGYLLTNNSHAKKEMQQFVNHYKDYQQFASLVVTGNRDRVLSGLLNLIEEEHLNANLINISDVIFKDVFNYTVGKAIALTPGGSIIGAEKALYGLASDIEAAERKNFEFREHSELVKWISDMQSPNYTCPAWDDMAFSYSGSSTSSLIENSIEGVATGQAREWMDAAQKEYARSGSGDGFEKWCDKVNDLTNEIDKSGNFISNYDYIKEKK